MAAFFPTPVLILRALMVCVCVMAAPLERGVHAGTTSEGARQEEGWLGDEAIEKAFSGKSIAGHYGDGRTFAETYEAGGRVDYSESGRGAGGTWSVIAGALCTIYDNDPTGGCYRVRQTGSNCFEFYFIARSTNDAAAGRSGNPAWTARGWLQSAPSTCKDDALV